MIAQTLLRRSAYFNCWPMLCLGLPRYISARMPAWRRAATILPVTRVPGAKSWIRGLSNVRGQLLPVIDTRAFLGSGAASVTRTTRVLVANHREIPAGLMVDEVMGFRRFYDHPASVSWKRAAWISFQAAAIMLAGILATLFLFRVPWVNRTYILIAVVSVSGLIFLRHLLSLTVSRAVVKVGGAAGYPVLIVTTRAAAADLRKLHQ